MRALVISGGGSKGAFAGGVAQYLIEEMKTQYDIFVGSSSGSLLISHLALDNTEKIKKIFTSVNQHSIFSNCPFNVTQDKKLGKQIKINHFNVLKQLLSGRKTFGESLSLKKLITDSSTKKEFETLKNSSKQVVVTVSNLSLNTVEYKSIKNFDYLEFCEWIWISCNYIPFMSLAKKGDFEYADGGFGLMVPVEEAICRGAKTVDVIVLDTEVSKIQQPPSKNVFSLLTNLHLYMTERISRQNIRIGKLVAIKNKVLLNFYYTPTGLTSNSLIFDSKEMTHWWQLGFDFAKNRNGHKNEIRPD